MITHSKGQRPGDIVPLAKVKRKIKRGKAQLTVQPSSRIMAQQVSGRSQAAAGSEVHANHPQPDNRDHGRFRPVGLASANEGRMSDEKQSGRDQETGRFLPGNRFWEARSSAGPKPKFEGPDALWAACCEYFDWNERNPLFKDQLVTFQGMANHEPIAQMRAMTISALCMFLDVDETTWRDWRESRPDLSPIITRVEAVIYRQKFEGSAADLLNANIIARDLGLADKRQLGNDPDNPIPAQQVTIFALPDNGRG